MSLRGLSVLGICLASSIGSIAVAQVSGGLGPGLTSTTADSAAVLLVEPMVEKTVEFLPPGPLHWRIDRFPTLEAATAAEGPMSLAAQAWGQAWLFTLGHANGVTPGGEKVAEVGPIPVPSARRFLLRVNRAGGPAGAKTPVHVHPGSEAFYVLRGQLSQRTSHGMTRVNAGEIMNGHEPGMVMQLESTGAAPLEQLVMFVVDAEKPFSVPASFDEP